MQPISKMILAPLMIAAVQAQATTNSQSANNATAVSTATAQSGNTIVSSTVSVSANPESVVGNIMAQLIFPPMNSTQKVQFTVGATITIEWKFLGNVYLEYRKPGEAQWQTIVTQANGTNYNWTVPADLAGSKCEVRMCSDLYRQTNSSMLAATSAAFEIAPATSDQADAGEGEKGQANSGVSGLSAGAGTLVGALISMLI